MQIKRLKLLVVFFSFCLLYEQCFGLMSPDSKSVIDFYK